MGFFTLSGVEKLSALIGVCDFENWVGSTTFHFVIACTISQITLRGSITEKNFPVVKTSIEGRRI